MATPPAASSATAAPPAFIFEMKNTISQTIFGSHMFRTDGFSGTKGLGVGESIDSSPFRVGGHDFYIRCYPSGDDEVGDEGIHKVSVFLLRLSDDGPSGPMVGAEEEVEHNFALIKHGGGRSRYFWRRKSEGPDCLERDQLEQLLKDNCLEVRCEVTFYREFPAVVTDSMAVGSHIVTVDGFSKTTGALFATGECIVSDNFRVGGYIWYLDLYPRGREEGHGADAIAVSIYSDICNGELKARLELTLLYLASSV